MNLSNALPTQTPNPTRVAGTEQTVVPFISSNRLGRPDRDFGIGYGKSSGYGTSRSYVTQWAQPRFRFA